jgi:hypothetical protein
LKSNLRYVKGDLFQNIPADSPVVIPHVCNDIGAWGAGFVVPLGEKYPCAKKQYLSWYKDSKNNINTETCPFALGKTQFVYCGENVFVANMICQHGVGGKRPLDYRSLVKCMLNPGFMNCSIVCPKFGSGLAGGDWQVIETYIKTIWEELDVTVYYL